MRKTKGSVVERRKKKALANLPKVNTASLRASNRNQFKARACNRVMGLRVNTERVGNGIRRANLYTVAGKSGVWHGINGMALPGMAGCHNMPCPFNMPCHLQHAIPPTAPPKPRKLIGQFRRPLIN